MGIPVHLGVLFLHEEPGEAVEGLLIAHHDTFDDDPLTDQCGVPTLSLDLVNLYFLDNGRRWRLAFFSAWKWSRGGEVVGFAVKCVRPRECPTADDEVRPIGTRRNVGALGPTVQVFPRLAAAIHVDVPEHIDHDATVEQFDGVIAVDRRSAG